MIRMDVAGLTRWGSSWGWERVCGRAAFERIVEICGKGNRPKEVNSRHLKVESKTPEATRRNTLGEVEAGPRAITLDSSTLGV